MRVDPLQRLHTVLFPQDGLSHLVVGVGVAVVNHKCFDRRHNLPRGSLTSTTSSVGYANTGATVSNTVMINVSMMALPAASIACTHVDTCSSASTQTGNQKDRLQPK